MSGRLVTPGLVTIWWMTVPRKTPIVMSVITIIWIFARSGAPRSSSKRPLARPSSSTTLGFITRPLRTYALVIALAATAVPVLKPRTVSSPAGATPSAPNSPCSARRTHRAA